MFQQAPQAPIIVTLVPKPSEATTFADVLLGSFSLTGALVLISLGLALVFALVLVRWNKRHRPEEDHMPHVTN